MFIIDAYDQNKKSEGVWVDYSGASFLIASLRSTKYVAAMKKGIKPYQKKIERKQEVDDAAQDEMICNALVEGVLLDWKEVYNSNGDIVEYNTENAVNALMFNEPFREFVVEFAADLENYKKENLEKTVKK